jgi:fibronectin-binding autotransporter adhesin
MAATNTASAGSTWAGATWSLGHVPTSSEDAVINSGVNLTIGTAAVCGSLTIGNATATATTLTIGAGGSLVISGTTGNLSINPNNVNAAMTLAVGANTLTIAGTPTLSATNTQTISVSTGSVSLTNASGFTWSAGTLTITGAGSISFSGLLTQSGGTIQNTTTAGTINFNGGYSKSAGTFTTLASEAINFGGNLTISGTALTFIATSTETFTATATITPTAAIAFGNLTVNSSATATVGGAVTVAGSFVANGTVAGTGAITLSGATNIDGTGSITNTATLTISAAHTILSTANLSFSGTISISGSITVTNNGTVTTTAAGGITGSVAGSTWSQGTTGTLNITGPLLTTGTLTASASGNTVNYNLNSGAAQTVKATATYHHLTLGGSGTKTLTTTTTAINGNLTLSGTAAATTVVGLTIGGSLNVGSGTAFTAAAFALTVSGATSVTGTLTISSATGTKAFNGDVTINNGGIWNNNTANAALTLPGNISNSGTFNAGTGVHTLSGTSKTISGTFSIPSVTVSGTYQNNGTLTVTTSLAGSGTLTNGATGTLNINFTGAVGLTNLTATASGNLVNYGFAGTQTIKATTYDDLTLSNSGAKTAAGALTVNSDFTMSGSASFNGGTSLTHTFLGNWIVNTSAATPFSFTTSSTINFNTPGTPAATSLSGSTSATIGFNNVNLNNTSGFSSTENFSITGTLTVAANVTFSPSSSAVVSGAGTLTGSGTVQVTRATGSADFTNQYTITNQTLTNLTVEFAGASAQGTGANTYGGLKINNSNGVTLAGNVTVNGTLTLASGNITTSSNKVIISSTGSVSRTSGQVVGNLQKNFGIGSSVSRTFEIGDSSNYTPVTVMFASVSVAGDLIASTTAGDHPNIGTSTFVTTKTANRYWTLTNSGITFTTYDVTLNFVSGDLDSGANTSNFSVGRYNSGWTYPTVGPRTSTSTQATSVSLFGDFQVGEASTTATWTGAVNNLWSNGGNWSGKGGNPPAAGDDLTFPAGASNLSTSNDITAGTSFNSISISGSGYTLAGNSIALAAGNLSDTNTSGSNTISLAISMSATRTFSISNAAETLTISGAISGAGGLTQSGNGKLILSGANTYNGATTISGGTLSVSADNNLGTAPGSPTAGQLIFNGGTLATTANFTLDPNRGIALNSAATIDTAASTTLTYNGIMAGTNALTKSGNGTLVLGGVNTYSGTTEVSAGVLNIRNASALGATSSGTTVDSGASLQLQGGISVGAEPLTLNNAGVSSAGAIENVSGTNSWSGAITLASPSTIGSTSGTITVSGNIDNATFGLTIGGAGNTTLSGVISNSGGLTKSGSGTLTLSGGNTFSGNTTISAGTLKLGAANVIPDGASKGDVVMNPSSGTATFDLGGFSETINGLTSSGAGSSVVDNSASSTTPMLTIGGNNVTSTFSGVIQNTAGTLALTKTGSGTLTLSGANTFSGSTTINAGTLSIGADNNLGTAPGSATAGSLTFGGGTLTTTASFTLNSNRGIVFNSTATIDVAASTTLTYVGIAAGSGGLTKTSAGTLILSGANTYSGTTTINAGVISISEDNNLGAAPGSATAGQLTFGGGTLASTATLTLNSNRGIAFNSTATIDVATSTTLTYGGIAAGSGGLTKTSAGILVLNGSNTYSGTTTISAGTLLVNGSQSSSALSLNGGTLGGTGTVGTITSTSSGGTVSPGSGPGILNTSNINWSTGSPTFSIELNGTSAGTGYDQLNVTGTVNLSGATLSGSVGFAPAAGTTFTIINNDGSDAVTGTFSGLSEGASVTLSGQTFTISYVGGTGNDVVLTRASPSVTLDNSVNPSGTQPPDTDLTYTISFTNIQCCPAQSLVIKDPIPANTDFKVGSESHDLGTSGLTVVVAYSSDNESTWTYTPVSGGGGALAGYDRNVTNIRWTFTGNLSQTSPNNNGSVSFITRIR